MFLPIAGVNDVHSCYDDNQQREYQDAQALSAVVKEAFPKMFFHGFAGNNDLIAAKELHIFETANSSMVFLIG